MRVKKKIISHLKHCYCISPLQYNNRLCFIVASDKQYGCELFDEKGDRIDEIWTAPGGSMSIVPLPGANGMFLATHCFYSPNDSLYAKLVLVRPENGKWAVSKVNDIPCLHRFDIVRSKERNYLIACTLKEKYETENDWRFPGKVLCSTLSDNFLKGSNVLPLKFEELKSGLLKNHGYSKKRMNGNDMAVISSENGIFSFLPPISPHDDWEISKILDMPCSDAVLIDFDGCGEDEILSLSPFHGDCLAIHKRIKGRYEKVWEYSKPFGFAHAIFPTIINGMPCVIAGCRSGVRELLIVYFDGERYRTMLIDKDTGCMNVYHQKVGGDDIVIAANGEVDEVAYYRLEI